MPYKKIVPEVSQSPDFYAKKKSFRHHGVMAGILIVLALLLRFGIPAIMLARDTPLDITGVIAWSLIVSVLWIWGCFHLVLHFGLHFSWGFAGLLFLVGIAIIFWAAKQKPKWDRQRAMQPKRSKEYQGDPDSLY